MDDFKRIFERMNIHQVRTFFLCGVEDLGTDMRSYEQRIKEEDEPVYKRLEDLYPDGQERDEFLSDINQAFVVREQVYLEMGMKAGARLIFELLLKQDENL